MRANVKRALFARRAGGGAGAGYFSKGNTSAGNYTNNFEKYLFANDTTVNGNAWAARSADGLAGSQSATTGYVYGGYNGAEQAWTDKVAFSSDATSNGTNLGVGTTRYGGAFGSLTAGIWLRSTGGSGTTRKYTYSSDAVANGGSSTTEVFLTASAGNLTHGYWFTRWNSGAGSNNTQKYTYSSDTCAAGGNLANSHYIPIGFGSQAKGYCLGTSSGSGIVSVYTYSSDTSASGTNVTNSVAGFYGTSDPIKGISAGQSISAVNNSTVRQYVMATDVVSNGGTLVSPGWHAYGAAPHSYYGGFN